MPHRVVGRRWALVGLVSLSVLSSPAANGPSVTTLAAASASMTRPSSATRTSQQTYLNVPIVFEPNRGQAEPGALFLARAAGYTLEIRAEGARMALRRDRRASPDVLEMDLARSPLRPAVDPEEPQPGRSHYFMGNDPAGHLRDIPQFGKIAARGIYPGIDLVYYGQQRRLEYDFVVAPGADPRRIGLRFRGYDAMAIDAEGNLVFRWGPRQLRQKKPVLYQLPGREPVNGRFALADDGTVGFDVEHWDRTKTLVIDPTLIFGTYLGGAGNDTARGVAVDGAGNVYVGGTTTSTNFSTVGPYLGANGGGTSDAFVTKINATGTAILYSTYVGGSNTDEGRGIAVDAAGSAYLVGQTSSGNFPTTSPITLNCASGDAFLAKLTPAGNALSYSLCFGTSGGPDAANAVAVDSASKAYVTGLNGATDAFVGRLNAAGNAFDYFKIVGGSGSDQGFGIAADSAGNACVTGSTSSTDFPVVIALQARGGDYFTDAFVAKYDPSGAVVYATYLGGVFDDVGNGAVIDATGRCYVVGSTFSGNFPTLNAAQPAIAGQPDAFVTAYTASGSAYLYSTYLGGTGSDAAWAIAASASGTVHVVGESGSIDFPMLNPVQAAVTDIGAVQVSANAGGTFSPTALSGESIQALAVDPTNAHVVYAGTVSGVYRSLNGGASWSPVNSGLTDTDILALAIDPNAHCTIYAGVDTHLSSTVTVQNSPGVLAKSTDCGGSWSYGIAVGRAVQSLALTNTSPPILYFSLIYNTLKVVGPGIGLIQPWESVVRLASTAFDFSFETPYCCNPDRTVASDPTDPCIGYYGQAPGGAGNVYRNTSCAPAATNWTAIGVLSGQVLTIAPHPTRSGTLLAGTSDGNVYRKADAASAWVSVATLAGSVNSIVYQPGNPAVAYAAGAAGIVYKSVVAACPGRRHRRSARRFRSWRRAP